MFLAWWSRAKEEIPTGWALCDGASGTPDLRQKFIRCAYSDVTRPPGGAGGEATHDHDLEAPSPSHNHATSNVSHRHNTVAGDVWASGSTHATNTVSHNHGSSDSKQHGHTVDPASNLPKYVELVIIGLLGGGGPTTVPEGAIAMWAGSIASVPSGWAFCDGGGGRPDLRDRFLKGASEAGSTGGSEEHAHDLSSGGAHEHESASGDWSHGHGRTGYPNTGALDFPRSRALTSSMTTHVHTLNSAGGHDHDGLTEETALPPFYVLAFIIKEGA